MVGVGGLEPPTSASRTLRATNCATLRRIASRQEIFYFFKDWISVGCRIQPSLIARLSTCNGMVTELMAKQVCPPILATTASPLSSTAQTANEFAWFGQRDRLQGLYIKHLC
jgi:hypothetical protein